MARTQLILALITITIMLLFTSKSSAACSSPSGTAGQLQYVSGFGQVRYCNGTSWIALDNTATATGCSTLGAVSFVSGEIMWCNGSVWVKSAPTTNYGACAGSDSGKFYYDTGGTYYWFCNGSNWRRMGP